MKTKEDDSKVKITCAGCGKCLSLILDDWIEGCDCDNKDERAVMMLNYLLLFSAHLN